MRGLFIKIYEKSYNIYIIRKELKKISKLNIFREHPMMKIVRVGIYVNVQRIKNYPKCKADIPSL